MRHAQWKVFGLVLLLALPNLRCAAPRQVPSLVKPTQVEVEGASPLIIQVSGMQKRPLGAAELSPPTKIGFSWEYRVTIANPSRMEFTLDRLRLTVQNLWGRSWSEDKPVSLVVPGGGDEKILVQARLASTDPQDSAALTGVETLTFLGQRDGKEPISFTVRVPLD